MRKDAEDFCIGYRADLQVTRREFLRDLALLGVPGVAALTACSSPGRPTAETDDEVGGGRQFTFLTPLPLTSLTYAPELLADAAGYFSDRKIEVKFEIARGSGQAMPLILAGRVPLTRISQIDGMRVAANREAPLVNVGMIFKESTIRYVSSARDPLREPKNFIGKTIGVPSSEGSSEMELNLFLAVSGIDHGSVHRQVVGLTPSVYHLVKEGKITGYAVSMDTAKIIERQHQDAVIFNPSNFMVSGGQFYMTSREGLARYRNNIRRFLDAIRDAVDFMTSDMEFERTLAILRSKYSFDALNDTVTARESLREYVRVWTLGGRDNVLLTSRARWAAGYNELVLAGIAVAGALPEKWFTNELVT